GFVDWQETYFPGETDPAIIGSAADPDGDGIPNLLEYLLGTDPTVASRENLPIPAVQTLTVEGSNADYLTLSFTVSDDITDVDYAVETGDAPADWSSDAVLLESNSNGDGTTTYTYRDAVSIDSGSRRFMRLN